MRSSDMFQISSIRNALKCKLPGNKAHLQLLPPGRSLCCEQTSNPVTQSSVLLLLFPKDDSISICLILRPSTMRHHAGQISFPGGKSEPADIDMIQTALRETYEEIGIEQTQIEILGSLTPLYVQISKFNIYPFVGWYPSNPKFKINPHEVDEIFTIPIDLFFHPQTLQHKKVATNTGPLIVPGYRFGSHFIWGTTAMIITEFKELISTWNKTQKSNFF